MTLCIILCITLLWKDSSGEVHPDLATDWKLSEDGLSMTVNLRHDVKGHDGKDFTAKIMSKCMAIQKMKNY